MQPDDGVLMNKSARRLDFEKHAHKRKRDAVDDNDDNDAHPVLAGCDVSSHMEALSPPPTRPAPSASSVHTPPDASECDPLSVAETPDTREILWGPVDPVGLAGMHLPWDPSHVCMCAWLV